MIWPMAEMPHKQQEDCMMQSSFSLLFDSAFLPLARSAEGSKHIIILKMFHNIFYTAMQNQYQVI